MSQPSLSHNLEPVLILTNTIHTNGLRQKQDIHNFVFDKITDGERIIALMDLLSFWGMQNDPRYIIVDNETSELFSFSARERRKIEHDLMKSMKKGDLCYPSEATSRDELAYLMLNELDRAHRMFGHTGRADAARALLLFDLLNYSIGNF